MDFYNEHTRLLGNYYQSFIIQIYNSIDLNGELNLYSKTINELDYA